MRCKKPPLGIKPKFIWEDERLFELGCAISRYLKANLNIPIKWIEEYNELIEKKKNDGIIKSSGGVYLEPPTTPRPPGPPNYKIGRKLL
ncbi:hypothetical protein [uncultured Clostridium sp.]|uniref:hypothetical protein n=1 Tax=uncultured Clostridium sp. TaxID=59620 RepID=UPI00262AA16B|nr:hypothetical protein [uncultured Clostridium sp.]